ncbi:MAG: translation initiation factor IF-3 [Candidatus Aureabacteria bacterium]|nr:translation initiation factor IF-3 [Candidatus Auribacterota bacterium]
MSKNDRSNRTRINENIRCSNLRLIDENSTQLGVKNIREALDLAKERGLDLVEIAAQADPPVCRIMDYGKYRYEQSKKEKLAKKKQHFIKVKEIKMTPRIDIHDFEIKARKALEFLEEGNKVKVTIRFRGREMLHKEFGKQVIDNLIKAVEEHGALESGAKMAGRQMSAVISPKSTPK